MTSILIIYKDGTIKEQIVKDLNNLYTICNYRNDTNFELLHTYSNMYDIYGKRTGKLGCINNYKFISPIDSEVFYGNLCIVKMCEKININLTLEEWCSYNLNKPHITEIINDVELVPEAYESD